MWAWLLACATGPGPADETGTDPADCTPVPWYPDGDADGFGAVDGAPVSACTAPAGYAAGAGDCDDTNPDAFPGNDDPCDGVDNNCDGVADPAESRGWADTDGDGAGDPDHLLDVCDTRTPAAPNAWDCDDTDARIPVFVAADGTAGGDGSVAAPLSTLDGALHTDLRCVRVLPGVYPTQLTFRGVDVDVASTDGPALTVLEGESDEASVVTFWAGETRAAALRGFTVQGGAGRLTHEEWNDGSLRYSADIRYGGGVTVSGASPTLSELVITGNTLPPATRDDAGVPIHLTQSEGAGVFVEYGAPLLEDVDLTGNTATYGAALYAGFDAEVQLRRVRVAENQSDYGAVYVAWGAVEADALVVAANTTPLEYDGLLVFYGALDLGNSTVVGHRRALSSWGASAVVVTSSILYDNGAALGDGGVEPTTWLLAYNDLYGNEVDLEGVSAIDPAPVAADPRFVDYSPDGVWNDDLQLGAGSPCVDAGDPATTDPDGSRADVGATGGPFAG